MIKRVLLLASSCISLLSCNSPITTQAIEINNLKVGLVCQYQSDEIGTLIREGRVCFETEEVLITGQGQCTYNGQRMPCTWYGFEFEYDNKLSVSEKIQCTLSSDIPSTIGNPESVTKEDATIFDYEITIGPGKGRFYNPQYSVYAELSQSEASIENFTTCSYKGNELFKFNNNLRYPLKRATK